MNNKITSKLVAGALIGAITLSVGTLDFAFSNKVSANAKSCTSISNIREDDNKENQKCNSKEKCSKRKDKENDAWLSHSEFDGFSMQPHVSSYQRPS